MFIALKNSVKLSRKGLSFSEISSATRLATVHKKNVQVLALTNPMLGCCFLLVKKIFLSSVVIHREIHSSLDPVSFNVIIVTFSEKLKCYCRFLDL